MTDASERMKAERAARLKQALRDNLRRRKAHGRDVEADQPPAAGDVPDAET